MAHWGEDADDGVVYRFDDHELDMARYELRLAGESVQIEPRAFDVLHHLVANHDRMLTRQELLEDVWGDRFVTEAALSTALRTARMAIGDSGREQRLIRTVHGRGYQFVAPVVVVASHDRDSQEHGSTAPDADMVAPPAAPTPPPVPDESGTPAGPGASVVSAGGELQTIRFCRAHDGTRIAYASVGSGPPLLKAANWMTHLDLEWTSPVWSHWLHGLARNRQLIRYDERACGMSDWDVPNFGFDDWVDDLGVVVDAIGIETFPLLGVSQGGAVAIAYAVAHPERVSRLILAGAYARGRSVRASTEAERDEAALDLELARVGWAREDPSFMQVFASQFLPDGTPEEWEDFISFQRQTASPANGVRFLDEFARIDVSAIAERVQCPTLILHSRDDLRVPASQARELAATIPDSTLVLLDSRNHLLGASEPAWPEFLRQVDDFLAA